MKRKLMFLGAIALTLITAASCGGKKKKAETVDTNAPVVYFTKEITPESLRIRKRILDPTLRKRANFNRNNQ